MRVRLIASDRFQVVGVMEGDECPTETFLYQGEASTMASRSGLHEMLQYVASNGLQGVPHGWFWLADRKLEIYEFRKGPLRLFFFKGNGDEIAVCTDGVRKSGQRADKQAVNKAAKWRSEYLNAQRNNTYEVVDDEAEQ